MQCLRRHSPRHWYVPCYYDTQRHSLIRQCNCVALQGALCIGARLDDPGTGSACRIAFSGRVAAAVNPADTAAVARTLRVYKTKQREGCIERVLPDGHSVVVRDLLKKETDVAVFVGLKVCVCARDADCRTVAPWQVHTPAGEQGIIQGGFGKSGKVKVVFSQGVASEPGTPVVLQFRRFVFDVEQRRKIIQ